MRQYKTQIRETKEIDKIICNKCGKEITIVGGVPSEDYLTVEKQWGYPSEKDNRVDGFELCEACYDEMIKAFKIQI